MSGHEDEVLGKAYDSRLMRRLLSYLGPYWPRAVGALAAIVAGVAFQLTQPYLVRIAIDDYIAPNRLAGVGTVAMLYVATLTGAFVAEFLQTTTLQMLGQRIMFDLRRQVFDKLQRLDLAYYDRNPVGRLMTRVTSDVDAINDLFTSGVVSVFGDLLSLVGITVVLFSLDWRLALLTLIVLPLIVAVTQWFRRHVRETYRDVRTWVARLNAFLQENLTGMSTVQIFRRERRNFEEFDAINVGHRDANIRSIFYYAVFYPAIELVGAVSTALIIWWGGSWVMDGSLTIGIVVAFLQYSQRFFRPISDMSEKFNLLQAAMASSERLFALIDTPVTILSPVPAARVHGDRSSVQPSSSVRPAGPGRFTFEQVHFAYGPGTEVLSNVSFSIEPGQRIGIVGATGSGKTTLINLLLRFYDVTSGRITVDGVDVRQVGLDDLRSNFALVLQDVYLFSGTIASNIRLGRSDITDDRVRRAAEAVHVDAFIRHLPQGYETPVAERGATLSVGQKQLLSFARALAFDPRVLVLDEATSSVDSETELLIRDALHVLMQGRTTLAIAHRLSTVQDMDRILVLHRGQLRESGTHQELLAQRGIYYRLYQLQYQHQADAPVAG